MSYHIITGLGLIAYFVLIGVALWGLVPEAWRVWRDIFSRSSE
jgi:hypothetical protein